MDLDICSQDAFVTSEALVNNTSQLALEVYLAKWVCIWQSVENYVPLTCPSLIHMLKSLQYDLISR